MGVDVRARGAARDGWDGVAQRPPPGAMAGTVPPPAHLGISQPKTHQPQVMESRAIPPHTCPALSGARCPWVCGPRRARPPSLLLRELPGGDEG